MRNHLATTLRRESPLREREDLVFVEARRLRSGQSFGLYTANVASLDPKAVADLHAHARASWPGVVVGEPRFSAALEATVAAGVALETVFADDLYLALGCLEGSEIAYAAFEKSVMRAVRPAVAHQCDDAATVDDVMQTTREKLLFGTPDTEDAIPKLAQYMGRGALVGWVRVVAVREALMGGRKSRRQRALDETELLEHGTTNTAGSLEISMLKRLHGASFRSAVHEALGRLTAEQRTLLRFHAKDKLSIDQLAPMLGIHRATAARRLEKARADALEHTREILHERHGLSESEAKSLCLALASEVDVSIGRALADEAP